jgi:hypothetical protein
VRSGTAKSQQFSSASTPIPATRKWFQIKKKKKEEKRKPA